MAQQQSQDTPKIGFKSIQLLKDQTLGSGSYGLVCKALCDNLLCAAKIIHQTLFDPNLYQQVERNREYRLPIQRFMQECEFMSAIKHPNIVQFLGTHQDPQTGLPVLLMELMDDSLTHFLESSQYEVPYHIQVNFCHDITLAISYLHSNEIIHRDLSSNNVLLYGNVQAKVTDFGMAQVGDKSLQATRVSFTLCPGTDVYMPPEAVKEEPEYTEKIDCFAIGTLIIQVLTRCYPDPGSREKIERTTDPRFPTVNVLVPEIERRQNHISLVDPNHPLLPIALDCLKDSDVERPSALELCYRVEALKGTTQFTESVRRIQEGLVSAERMEEIRELEQQVEAKDRSIHDKNDVIQQREDELHQMREEHSKQIENLQKSLELHDNNLQKIDEKLQERNNILSQKEAIIREKEDIIKQTEKLIEEKRNKMYSLQRKISSNKYPSEKFQKEIDELQLRLDKIHQQIHDLEQKLEGKSPSEVRAKSQADPKDPPQSHDPETSTGAVAVTRENFKLKWREGPKAPGKLWKEAADAVVHGNNVYLKVGSRTVYSYNSTNNTWNDQLPECETRDFAIAVVDNCLTAIGGREKEEKTYSYSTYVEYKETNKFFRLTKEGESMKWTEWYKRLPTKRIEPIAVCMGKYLIVAGGYQGELHSRKTHLATVEILNLKSYDRTTEWTRAADLPHPIEIREPTATVCDDRIYISGIRGVYSSTLTHLLQSCGPISERDRSQSLSQNWRYVHPWSTLLHVPNSGTLATFHGQVLSIGGKSYKTQDGEPLSDVRIYNPEYNSWEVIGKMNTSRVWCFAAVLPTNELMVIEGKFSTSKFAKKYSVEIATIA